jgi:neutral amino acid transport system permease protein
VIDSTDVGAVRFALVGLMLMLLMVFRPQGVLGRREELLLDAD